MNQITLLYRWYITSNTNFRPSFTCVSERVVRCKIAAILGGSVKICWRLTNKLWGWGEQVLCSLWPTTSWILRFALKYNLIRFTDICLELSLIIFLAKHDISLDHVVTRSLIWTACTAEAPWIGINWVPADTLDIPNFSIFSQFWRQIPLTATEK